MCRAGQHLPTIYDPARSSHTSLSCVRVGFHETNTQGSSTYLYVVPYDVKSNFCYKTFCRELDQHITRNFISSLWEVSNIKQSVKFADRLWCYLDYAPVSTTHETRTSNNVNLHRVHYSNQFKAFNFSNYCCQQRQASALGEAPITLLSFYPRTFVTLSSFFLSDTLTLSVRFCLL